MFTAHSVAVAATRAVYRAASRETRRTKTPSSPPSAKYPHKYSAHSTRSATLRNARRSNRVAYKRTTALGPVVFSIHLFVLFIKT